MANIAQAALLLIAGFVLVALPHVAEATDTCRDCTCINTPKCTVDCETGEYVLTFDGCGPVKWAGSLKYNSVTSKSASKLKQCSGTARLNDDKGEGAGGDYCDNCIKGASFSVPKDTRYCDVYVQDNNFKGDNCGSTRYGACGCGGSTYGQCSGYKGGVS